MAFVHFDGHTCEMQAGESVLDSLLRCGVSVAHACKAGSCGSCMLRAVAGTIPSPAQAGLKDSWKAQGYFLACICRPEGDLTATEVGADARIAARITAIEPLSPDVLRVRLTCAGEFDFYAGQYLTLVHPNGLARSYSIASLPHDGVVELHVRLIPGGRMSSWLRDEARPGVAVQLQGPSGECFYVPGQPEQPILLIGTGTGLAPLYGILRDALRAGHTGPVHLIHGAVQPAGLYLRAELAQLHAAHKNFSYTPTVLHADSPQADSPGNFEVGSIEALLAARFLKLAGWRGFVCGDPGLVRSLKRKLFLAGMAMRDINSDAFLPSA